MQFRNYSLPKADTRLTNALALEHPTFVADVMSLWDRRLDTNAIAKKLFEHEHVVAFCLRIGRERRRGQVPCFASVEVVSLAMRG